METVVIFSGTTEGRILSSLLTREKILHIVCVATDYGRDMMPESPYARIRVGRMNSEEMKRFLSETAAGDGSIVIDATHPYAAEATVNIKRAAADLGIRYIRVLRDAISVRSDGIQVYEDMAECAGAVDQTDGNIFLTTGSKELGRYFANVTSDTLARTYVRVLPSAESLQICETAGIVPGHIIAMQGPFSRELNEAIIKQYHIKHLITKDSGAAGGFEEKVSAAAGLGARIHVIARPQDEDGVSIIEAYRIITGREAACGADDLQEPRSDNAADNLPKPEPGNVIDHPKVPEPGNTPCNLKITLIGSGMGAPDCRTAAADRALDECDAVFGAGRLLKNISCPRKYEMYLASDIIPVLEKEKIQRAAIVFSGDTGFYSGANGMVQALRRWREDIKIRVIPGISSIAYLASKLGESYDDACLFSIHGRSTEKDLGKLADKVIHHKKVFVLLSGAEDVPEIAKTLIRAGIEGRMVTGARLSYENESVREMSLEEALAYNDDGIVTALIYNAHPVKRPLINVRRDSEFVREKVPMTKECIRHESIIRLGLREDDVFYDIGGGTGSVALEAASLHPSLTVFTIDRKHDAVELIRKNAGKMNLANVTVLEGEAETVLQEMQKPDCVFVGGSGGRLREIIGILHSKGAGIRFVINAVSMETIEEARKIIREYEPSDEEAVMISVSDVRKTGTSHLLRAQNPVWIFSFTI